MIKPKKLAAYALVGTLLASSAFADDIRTLTATWDGSANGNSATAVATFDLDVTAINIKLNNNTGGNYYGGLSGYLSNMTLYTILDCLPPLARLAQLIIKLWQLVVGAAM